MSAQATLVTGLGGDADFGTNDLGLVDDEDSGAISLTTEFPNGLTLGATTYDSVVISANGIVSLGGTVGAGSNSILAWFTNLAADVDLAPLNRIYWDAREGQFIATWNEVGYCCGDHSGETVSFQIILRDRSGDPGRAAGDFSAEVRYGVVGLRFSPSALTQVLGVDLPGTGTTDVENLSSLSNVADPGVFRFEVRAGVVTVCGDETTDDGEECDDGNGADDDGCSSVCLLECADDDDDGVCNEEDVCTGDDTTGDSDEDGVCDDVDVCVGDDATGDDDEDGVCNDGDVCSGDDTSGDTDSDGVCDDVDACEGDDTTGDEDDDGICNELDVCVGADDSGDSDSDGVCDDTDVCPLDSPDDSDDDGVCDSDDLCEGDDASGDDDDDGVCDDIDRELPLIESNAFSGAGGDCSYGGVRIDTGIDRDNDGELAEEEIADTSYICNGEPGTGGATASLIRVSDEPAGDNCENGGVRVETGIDDGADDGVAANGELEDGEVTQTSYVCNGVDGVDGANGADGAPGADGDDGAPGANGEDGENGADGEDGVDGKTSLSTLTVLPEGDEQCSNGGFVLSVGVDGDGNGALDDDEVQNDEVLCNGTAGVSSVIDTDPLSKGDVGCPDGGLHVRIGLDNGDDDGDAGNGKLEKGEVDFERDVCLSPTDVVLGGGGGAAGACSAMPGGTHPTNAGLALGLLAGALLVRRRRASNRRAAA